MIAVNDGLKVNMSINPLNKWWHPIPNLMRIDFKTKESYTHQSFILNFTIKNNGIWKAVGIRIIVDVPSLNKTLYDNSNNLFDLDVDESKNILKKGSRINKSGENFLNIIDSYNLINETYSNKEGSLRPSWKYNNSFTTILKITPSFNTNNEVLNWIIFLIVLSISFTARISLYIVIKSKMRRNIIIKRKIAFAEEEIRDFKIDLYVFIKDKLSIIYDLE